MPDLRDVLIAYSNNQAKAAQVWRALTEHSGWYVPASFAVGHLQTTSSDGAMLFAGELPTPDNAAIAAAHAEGAPIGTFMREFPGVPIFQALDAPYGCVRVNPHSPKSESWYISQEAFPLAHLWAQVVRLEQSLAASSDKIPAADIAAYPGFLVLINADNLPVTLNLSHGSYAVAFTSPDRFQSFVAKQPAEQHANLLSATLDGATLCRQLQDFDITGVVIYYGDKESIVVRKEDFASIAGPAE
jgi:hypothetical protein